MLPWTFVTLLAAISMADAVLLPNSCNNYPYETYEAESLFQNEEWPLIGSINPAEKKIRFSGKLCDDKPNCFIGKRIGNGKEQSVTLQFVDGTPHVVLENSAFQFSKLAHFIFLDTATPKMLCFSICKLDKPNELAEMRCYGAKGTTYSQVKDRLRKLKFEMNGARLHDATLKD